MTAKGKITTVRLVPGQTRIMVEDLGNGLARDSATKIKGATPALVVKMNRVPAGTPYKFTSPDGRTFRGRHRRSYFELGVLTDDGRRLEIHCSAPSQTYWLAASTDQRRNPA